jgi:hypothetical protein
MMLTKNMGTTVQLVTRELMDMTTIVIVEMKVEIVEIGKEGKRRANVEKSHAGIEMIASIVSEGEEVMRNMIMIHFLINARTRQMSLVEGEREIVRQGSISREDAVGAGVLIHEIHKELD